MKWLLRLFLLMLLLGGAAAAGGYLYITKYYDTPNSLTTETTVIVKQGWGVRQIAEELWYAKIIDDVDLYRINLKLEDTHTQLKAGEYIFPPAITPREVTQILMDGKSVSHSVTIPEGLVTTQILAIIDAEPLLTGELPNDIAEGSLLPDTYFFNRGDSKTDIVTRMQKAMDEKLRKTLAHASGKSTTQ